MHLQVNDPFLRKTVIIIMYFVSTNKFLSLGVGHTTFLVMFKCANEARHTKLLTDLTYPNLT